MRVHDRTSGNSNCPYCANRRVNHTNSLWTTHPEVARQLKDHKIGYSVTFGSSKKVKFICNRCTNEDEKQIRTVVSMGYSCSKCSDGISYPEKLVTNILEQLNVEFERERSFDWSINVNNTFKILNGSKKYDFYIPSFNCIIETHGLQHYEECFTHFKRKRNLIMEQENDRLKEKIARENGIKNYIVIDCRKSELEYIKNNIISSKLSKIIPIKKINWLTAHEHALNTNMIQIACDLYNKGTTNTTIIGKELSLAGGTINRYLKQGAELGWCNYDPQKSLIVNRRLNGMKRNNHGKQVIQFSKTGLYIKTWCTARIAGQALGVSDFNIRSACRGNKLSAGGYKWMYEEDYKKYGITFVIEERIPPIIQLSKSGEFIQEFESSHVASRILGIDIRYINKCLKGERKSAYGYKWEYKISN